MENASLKTAAALGALALALGACSTARTLVRTQPSCADQSVQVYFEPDSAEITDEGRAVIRQAAAMARGCAVDRIEVVGLADAAGAPAANLALSERRAQAVTAALAGAGLPAAEFSMAAAGQSGAVTPSGEARPLRRRADIMLHLSAAK